MKSELDRATLRRTCERVVHELSTRYKWSVGTEEELVASVMASIDVQSHSVKLTSLVVSHYMATLYEACRQSADEDLQTRAYTELFNALYRLAYKRWPDIAQEVSQRALNLVAEHLEKCREPRAFLDFAFFKQLQAAKDIIREQGNDLPFSEVIDYGERAEQLPPDEHILEAERLQILLDALKQLDSSTRQAIVLKYFEGLSDTEIGERIKKTAAHVRVLRNRGIARLRKNPDLRAHFNIE